MCIVHQRLASELMFIDVNEDLVKAEAEDLGHAAAFIGNPKIVGTKDYSLARDATICVITAGNKKEKYQDTNALLDENLDIFKIIIPNVCKYAPNSILVIVTAPVDILSFAAMKLSGFPPNRVIGIGTFLDSCRFQYYIAQKLGISANSVQAHVIGENGPICVPVWSAVSVMGVKLKDINKEIGTSLDPEGWNEIHDKVIGCYDEMLAKKGYYSWGIGICVGEIVDAIVRNTCICITVSAFVKGCRHGLEKDIFMSVPCLIGRNGIQSYVRQLYTPEEQELTTQSCRSIYEAQKRILDKLE